MFDDLLVHESTRKQLELIAGNPPHAVLLAGEAHLGKHLLARTLAAHLLGTTPTTLESLGSYRELAAVKGKLPIEVVRGIGPFLSLKMPGNEKIKRVVCIPEADAMTIAAQNTLLKVLEEPPVDAVIILTTSHLDAVLPTIRSRCQFCRVKKPSETATRTFLHDYNADQVSGAMLASSGAIGETLRILTSESNESDDIQAVKRFLGMSMFDQLIAADTYAKDRAEATKFVSLLLLFAEKGLLHSRSVQWQKILQASLIAETALAKNANAKLVLMELVLSLR